MFLSDVEKWLVRLQDVEEFVRVEERRPSERSKDEVEKKLGKWLAHQVTNYDSNVGNSKLIMRSNSRVRTRWKSFCMANPTLFRAQLNERIDKDNE